MIDVRNDIDVETKADEAEETRYVPGARLVKALDFHSNIVGSKPIWNTNENWCKNMNFRITKKDIIVAGNDYSRLSVLT